MIEMENPNIDQSLELRSNVKPYDISEQYVKETLQFLADSLSKSLGYYGAPTIIQDRFLKHKITKDGYTILKSIDFNRDIPRIILEMVKSISRNQVRTVGDGTTSSIIVANALYKTLMDTKKRFSVPPKLITDCINMIYEIMADPNESDLYIGQYAKQIGDNMEELKLIASVSCNNDQNNGDLVYNLFKEIGRYGIVSLEKSKTTETYYEITKGIELTRGYTNLLMATDKNNMTVEYLNPLVFMIDDIVREDDLDRLADFIGKVCGSLKQPLIIVAKGFSPQFDTFVQANLLNNKGNLPLVAVPMACGSSKERASFEDLSILLGATIFEKSAGANLDKVETDELITYCGSCQKFYATETSSQFIEGDGDDEEIEARKQAITDKIKDLTRNESYIENDEEIFKLRKRLAGLSNSLAVLYVGGNSESEKETDKYLLEDAVFACRSALEHGYVFGGNLVIPIILDSEEKSGILKEKLLNKLADKMKDSSVYEDFIDQLIDDIYTSFTESYLAVLNNFYHNSDKSRDTLNTCISDNSIFNLVTLDYESINDTRIINSLDTDLQIFKSVSSIIGLLATVNQFITLN